MGFAFAGGYVVSVGLPFVVGLFDTPQEGYQYGMLIFSGVATALLVVCFATTRERIQPPEEQKLTLWGSLEGCGDEPAAGNRHADFHGRDAVVHAAPDRDAVLLQIQSRPRRPGARLFCHYAADDVRDAAVRALPDAARGQGGRRDGGRGRDHCCCCGPVLHAVRPDHAGVRVGVADGDRWYADCRAWVGDDSGYRGICAVAHRCARGRIDLFGRELLSEAGQDDRRRRRCRHARRSRLCGQPAADRGFYRRHSLDDDRRPRR